MGGDFVLAADDLLVAQGRVEEFQEFLNWRALEMASGSEIMEVLSSEKLAVMTAEISPESELVGLTVLETDFRNRFDAHILAVRRPGKIIREGVPKLQLESGDTLILD